jgi:hypothetical protein
MKHLSKNWRWVLLPLLLTACGQVRLDVVTPTVAVATTAASETPPAATPVVTPEVTPTTPAPTEPDPTGTAEPSATPGTNPAFDAPVEGLTYSAPDGIYWVDMNGQQFKIFDRPDAAISPDARQALYVEGGDIWLTVLGSGEATNLTNTPDREEHSPHWWQARTDIVVFGSYPVGTEPRLNPLFLPSMVRTDGTDYRVLDSEVDASSVGLSPDGHTIAYGLGPVGYLYDIDTNQRTVFDPRDYGIVLEGTLPAPSNWSVGGPAFSSDGTHMSWTMMLVFDDGNNQVSQIIVDLAAHTYSQMHVYHMGPSDATPVGGAWSPDGQWLAYFTLSADPSDYGIWAARADGTEERYLGSGYGAVWRDDGGWVAYNGSQGLTVMFHAEDWRATSFSGPVNSGVIGW